MLFYLKLLPLCSFHINVASCFCSEQFSDFLQCLIAQNASLPLKVIILCVIFECLNVCSVKADFAAIVSCRRLSAQMKATYLLFVFFHLILYSYIVALTLMLLKCFPHAYRLHNVCSSATPAFNFPTSKAFPS